MEITLEQFLAATTDWQMDTEDAICTIAEANATDALSFFGIVVNDETYSMILSRSILQADIDTVNDYLALIDNDVIDNESAIAYDNHTKELRGADDGTYDYAGSYVLEILERIMICQLSDHAALMNHIATVLPIEQLQDILNNYKNDVSSMEESIIAIATMLDEQETD